MQTKGLFSKEAGVPTPASWKWRRPLLTFTDAYASHRGMRTLSWMAGKQGKIGQIVQKQGIFLFRGKVRGYFFPVLGKAYPPRGGGARLAKKFTLAWTRSRIFQVESAPYFANQLQIKRQLDNRVSFQINAFKDLNDKLGLDLGSHDTNECLGSCSKCLIQSELDEVESRWNNQRIRRVVIRNLHPADQMYYSSAQNWLEELNAPTLLLNKLQNWLKGMFAVRLCFPVARFQHNITVEVCDNTMWVSHKTLIRQSVSFFSFIDSDNVWYG